MSMRLRDCHALLFGQVVVILGPKPQGPLDIHRYQTGNLKDCRPQLLYEGLATRVVTVIQYTAVAHIRGLPGMDCV